MNQYDVEIIKTHVNKVAIDLAQKYELPLRSITFIKGDAVYGMCSKEGRLSIKLEYFDGELVPEMEVWRTLAHEMAHLRHFHHHHEFWLFNKELIQEISILIGKKIRPEVAFFLREGKGVVS